MNTFAESPLLFFMDNISPVLPVNTSKDARKIVELADMGCDARLPVQPDRDYRHSPKLHKLKSSDWAMHTEDDKYDKCYDDRCRMKNKRNTVDLEDYHFNKKNDSTNQHRWQRCPPQAETTEDKFNRGGKRSPTRDIRSKLKTSPQEAHRWKDDKRVCEEAMPSVFCPTYSVHSQNAHALAKERMYEAQMRRSRAGPGVGLKFAYPDHPEMELHAVKRDARSARENEIHMVLDYPENFETGVGYPASTASRMSRDHDRRPTGSPVADGKNYPGQRAGKLARPRTPRAGGSPKLEEPTKDWREAAEASRIRSRTRSPPIDRRRNALSYQKSCYEAPEQCRSRFEGEPAEPAGRADASYRQPRRTNSNRSVKMFVDRAVDKDSMSMLLNVATSVQRLTDPTDSNAAADVSKEDREQQRNARPTYWDFIPLNDQNYMEYKKIVSGKGNQSLGGNCRLMEGLPRERGAWKADDEGRRDSLNLYLYEKPLVPAETTGETTLGASCPSSPKATETPQSREEEQRGESRDKGRSAFGYRWRPMGQVKIEPTGDGEKEGITDAIDGKGIKSNIVEWTAACLKRKLGKLRANGVSAMSNQSRPTVDKKFRSELPIRITNRRRSKNPSPTRFRFIARARVASEEQKAEESADPAETSADQPGSARSRTKPKLRPSVPHNRAVVDSVEASESFPGAGGLQAEDETKGFLKSESAGRSESLGNNVTGCGTRDGTAADAQTTSAALKFFDGDADDKFRNNGVERKEFDDFNAIYAEDDERRTTKLANGFLDRKVPQRKGFKEPSPPAGFACDGLKDICCFHLNDAHNIAGNGRYYDKDNRKFDSPRLRKPTVARSRF